MAINLDTQAASAAAPERLNRHNAQARQERWMAQLQDALFVHAAPAPAGAAARPGAQAQDGQPARQHSRQGSGGAARPDRPAGAAGAATRQAAPAQAGLAGAARAVQAGSAAAPGPGCGLHLRWITPALPAQAQQEASGPAAAPLRAGAGRALGAAVPLAGQEPAPAEAAALAQDAGAGAAAEQDAQYARRLLHVYQDQDGVQAWLRDAALTPGQAAAVAAALAGELAGEGQTLAALTINGKRMEAGALRRAADAANSAAHDESIAEGSQLPAHQPGKV
ncbi:hypothetical protein SAMN05518865_12178 [Duganella sp. CF458]|uniref:hypothetical protein n=1 Tax=Duganella sp. CF458 TaxID=1884368 RepID=UPI0008F169A2|nr:hypothetical protein [Duganella sp. CF458]SFG88777.1 hypothetical protein SAMN05518865_12178 [Duganella sp. CF458]